MAKERQQAALDEAGLRALIGPCADAINEWVGKSAVIVPAHSAQALASSLKLPTDADIQLLDIGSDSNQNPIPAYRFTSGSGDSLPRILLYGWPHPDEPLGALALRWLLEHADDARLPDADWLIIPCADPVVAAWSQRWADGKRTLEEYAYQTMRLEHLQREVDYQFPILSKHFFMPPERDHGRACTNAGRCVDHEGCGDTCLRLRSVPGPLAESLALARAIDMHRPHLVVGLHNSAAGGSYNFLNKKPDDATLADLAQISDLSGQVRHLGLKIDPGKRWSRAWPDAMQEPSITDAERRFLRRHKIADPQNKRWYVHASCAQYLHWREPDAEYLVPETGGLIHPDFANTAPYVDTRDAKYVRHDMRTSLEAALKLPWGQKIDVIYRWRLDPPSDKPSEGPVSLTLGMLGIEALHLRRQLLEAADALWEALNEQARASDHPYAAERRAISLPGHLYGRQSLRWLQSERYARTPSHAEHADYAWRWALESCALAGRCLTFARTCADEQGHLTDAAQQKATQLEKMIEATLKTLPLHDNRVLGAASQLARAFYMIEQARERP